eukprot:m.52492 g.52492  ORF g.52492 m.52492 type:complete len:163 (-) comp21617_c0_seq1:66-554(-)
MAASRVFSVVGIVVAVFALHLMDVVIAPYGMFVTALPLASTACIFFSSEKRPSVVEAVGCHVLAAFTAQILGQMNLEPQYRHSGVLALLMFAMNTMGWLHAPSASYGLYASQQEQLESLGWYSLVFPGPLGTVILVIVHDGIRSCFHSIPKLLSKRSGKMII